jgi:hypothetical protein
MDQYRPWLIAGSAALMLAFGMGTLVNCLRALFIPIETAERWRRSDVAAINSLGLLSATQQMGEALGHTRVIRLGGSAGIFRRPSARLMAPTVAASRQGRRDTNDTREAYLRHNQNTPME